MEVNNQLQSVLGRSFQLPESELVSREAIIQALTIRVGYLLETNSSKLFSLLYRLDISERNIKQAMAARKDVAKKIAVLIYERQLEKIVSRERFKPDEPDEELAW
jgi:hypothetical protein